MRNKGLEKWMLYMYFVTALVLLACLFMLKEESIKQPKHLLIKSKNKCTLINPFYEYTDKKNKVTDALPKSLYQVSNIEHIIVVHVYPAHLPIRLHGGLGDNERLDEAVYPDLIVANLTPEGLRIEVPRCFLQPNTHYTAIRVRIRNEDERENEMVTHNRIESNDRVATDNTGTTNSRVITDNRGTTNNRGATDNTGTTNSRVITDNRGTTNNRGATDNTGTTNRRGATDNTGTTNSRGATDNTGTTNNRGATDNTGTTNNRGATDNTGTTNNRGATDNTGTTNNRDATDNMGDTGIRDAINNRDSRSVADSLNGMEACAASRQDDETESSTGDQSSTRSPQGNPRGMVSVTVHFGEAKMTFLVLRGMRVDDFVRSEEFIQQVRCQWGIRKCDLQNMVLRDHNQVIETFDTDCKIRLDRGHMDLFLD